MSTPKKSARGIQIKQDIGETIIPGNPAAILPIAVINIDDAIQQRVSMDAELVLEYQTNIGEWIARAPVIVYGTESVYWLADGFHRLAAASGAGLTEISAIIYPGTRRDALLYAIGANATHGKPRTNADKRRAVETLLADAEWSGRSDRWIAETAKVSPPLIARVRTESTVNIYSSAPDADQLQISAREQVAVESLPLRVDNQRRPSESYQSASPPAPLPEPAEPAQENEWVDPGDDAEGDHEQEVVEALAPIPQKRIGRDGKTRYAPFELTRADKARFARAQNQKWERRTYEIERQLRIGAEKHGRDKVIAFLRDRLAAMEKEVTQ